MENECHPVGGGWMNSTLEEIILGFRGSDEPLDSDGVNSLIEILRAKINLHESNITEAEYEEILG